MFVITFLEFEASSSAVTNSEKCKPRLQLHCQDTFLNQVRELKEFDSSCSCNAFTKIAEHKQNCVDKTSTLSSLKECVMRATENGKEKIKTTTKKLSKIRMDFLQHVWREHVSHFHAR